MGLFDSIGKIVGTAVGGPVGFLAGDQLWDKPNEQRRDAQSLQEQQNAIRAQSTRNQLASLNNLQGPSYTPQMEARLKALEEGSKEVPLTDDPYFQGDRAQLVQGGRSILSDVENRKAATGATTGGFSNIGSANDVMDRMGVAVSNLGQQARQARDQRAMTAANARQQLQDSQIAFANQKEQARIAIEAGDSQAASAALQNAYNLKQQINAQQAQLIGGLVSTAGTVAGAAVGPGGAAAGSRAGALVPGQQAPVSYYQQNAQLPSSEDLYKPQVSYSNVPSYYLR